MHFGAEGWVGVAFVIFIGLLLYLKVHRQIAAALDKRSDAISAELDEAARIRHDAEVLLASLQKKHRDVNREADAIIAQAKQEAELAGEQARHALEESLHRRSQQVSDKIAREESQAIDRVRNLAVEVAAKAAEKLLRDGISEEAAKERIDASIRELPEKLH